MGNGHGLFCRPPHHVMRDRSDMRREFVFQHCEEPAVEQGLADRHRLAWRRADRWSRCQHGGIRGPLRQADLEQRLLETRGGLWAHFFGRRQGPVDRFQKRRVIAPAVAGLLCRHHRVVARARGRLHRLLTGDHPVHHRPQRIQVAPRPLVALRVILLQRRVARRDDGGEFRHAAGGARRAEVDQDRAVFLAYEDVGRLDVAMQVAGAVHHLETVEQRQDQRQHRCLRRRPARHDPVVEWLAGDEFHHHVGSLVGFEKAHHTHDVGVAERGQGARFVEKARAPPGEGLDRGFRLHRH